MKTASCYRWLTIPTADWPAAAKPPTPAEILSLSLQRPRRGGGLRITLRSSSSSSSYFSSSSSSSSSSLRLRIIRKLKKKRASSPMEVGPIGAGVGPCSYSIADREGLEVDEKKDRRVEVAVAAAATVVLGVGNRVLYKLALVPLKHYPFFLAQLATFGYVIVYFTILYVRYHAGVVTYEMLSMPKAPFLLVGLLEALAAATGMAAAGECGILHIGTKMARPILKSLLLFGMPYSRVPVMLSGASIPILSQTFLVWQILLSTIFLGRRYKANQLLGCLLVTIGVIITVASGSTPGHSLKDAGIFWTLLMIFSFFLQAADTVLKETIFLDSCQQLKGCCVDLFVVNSYGSAFQALFVCLLLPFLSKLWGVPFSQLANYLKDGAICFLNVGGLSSGCDGAPILPLLFVVVNMGFNISLLHLIKISSAVVSSLASTFSVPISVYMFTLPLPYLGVASSLPAGFVVGAIVLLVGLIIYAWTPQSDRNSASMTSPN